MAVRIRVYPQNGMGAFGGLGVNGYGGAVSAQTYYNSRLQSQKQVSNLQLGYERALADERIEKVRLEERLKNPYLQTSMVNPYAMLGGLGALNTVGGLGGLGALNALGGLGGIGTMPMISQLPMMGGLGSGQTNVTNQSSNGGAAQTVTNSNVNNVSHTMRPIVQQGGWGFGSPSFGFGGGGLISGLLGALI